jgi:predicted ester cyclase
VAAGPGPRHRQRHRAVRLPPTGKPISIDVIDVAPFADGQMIEHWGVPDRMSILQQLGHHP